LKRIIFFLGVIFFSSLYFYGYRIGQTEQLTKLSEDYSDADKQKKAVIDLNNIAVCLTDYITDGKVLPKQDGPITEDSELFKSLVPYIPEGKNIPIKDPWGNDYLIYCGTAATGKYGISGCVSDDFLIISYGADGKKEKWLYNPSNRESGLFDIKSSSDYAKDLVDFNGNFIRAPKNYESWLDEADENETRISESHYK